MESNVNPENFFVVQGWMITELSLKGNDLMVYAIIYGFSQSEGGRYFGTLQYLADWLSVSKQTVIASLKHLLDAGLIDKKEHFKNGVKNVEYYSKNLNTLFKNFEYPIQKTLMGGSQKTLTNNIEIDNTSNNKNDDYNSKPAKPQKIHYSTFVTLTEEEHQKLIDKHGETGTAEIIEILDAYKEANNKKYASDAGAIRSWVADEWQKRKATMPQKKQEEPKKQVEEELDFMDQLEIYKQQKIEEAKRNGTYIDDGSDINF